MNSKIGVFDAHSDLFTNVTLRRQAGETEIIRHCHRAQLQAGNIGAMICCVWIDPPFTDTPTNRMVDIMGSSCAELRTAADVAEVAYCTTDIERICTEGSSRSCSAWRGSAALVRRSIS